MLSERAGRADQPLPSTDFSTGGTRLTAASLIHLHDLLKTLAARKDEKVSNAGTAHEPTDGLATPARQRRRKSSNSRPAQPGGGPADVTEPCQEPSSET
jgi:hypothetical protein